jgi:hypothetical protein
MLYFIGWLHQNGSWSSENSITTEEQGEAGEVEEVSEP